MVITKKQTVIVLIALWTLVIPAFQNVSAALVCGSTIMTSTSLNSDLLGCATNGLTIGANGISLNCQGHTISGSNAPGSMGILASGRTGLTITNCRVNTFIFGVYLNYSSFNKLTFNTINANSKNANGIELNRAHNNTLTSNTAYGAGYLGGSGFHLAFASNNTFISNTSNNSGDGFRIESTDGIPSSPSYNTFRSNTANFDSSGFTIHTSSTVLTGNKACYDQVAGFYQTFGANGLYAGNTACSAGQYGIILAGSINNTVKSNILTGSSVGLELSGSSNNVVYNNLFANVKNVEKEAFLGGPDASYDAWNTTKTLGVNIVGGPYVGGNYWSDYTGHDSNGDGIGDTVGPYDSGGDLSRGDALPLCTSMGCGLELKALFEQDWVDYNNDGKITILDVASAAFAFGGPSSYWDLYQAGRVGIIDVALVTFNFGRPFTTPYLGEGQPAGHMDPTWKQFCVFLTPTYASYCQARI